MKKLIVAALAAVAMVGAANAANLKWSWSGEFKDAKGNALDTSKYTAYLYRTSDQMKPTAPEAGNRFKIPQGLTYVESSGWDSDNSRFGDFEAHASEFNASYKGWMIVLAESTVSRAALESGVECYAAVITGNTKYKPAAGGLMELTDTNGGQLAWYGDPEPTPEPTSAVLMLLGVAGLALKRRQRG